MKGITIGDLVSECITPGEVDIETYEHTVSKIEIVPRKIVEMIIDKCFEHYDIYGEHSCAGMEALTIKEYAKDLLRKFEGYGD